MGDDQPAMRADGPIGKQSKDVGPDLRVIKMHINRSMKTSGRWLCVVKWKDLSTMTLSSSRSFPLARDLLLLRGSILGS